MKRKGESSAKKSQKRRRKLRSLRRNFLATKRFVFRSTYGGSDVNPTGQDAVGFSISDIPQNDDFVNTFDMYRITGIRYRWAIYRDPNLTGATLSGTVGLATRVMWAIDYTDVSPFPLGSFAPLQAYDTCKEVYLNSAMPVSKWYYFKPQPLAQMSSGYSTTIAPWLRTLDNVTYYGMKYGWDGNQAGQQLRLECYYYIELKSVK